MRPTSVLIPVSSSFGGAVTARSARKHVQVGVGARHTLRRASGLAAALVLAALVLTACGGDKSPGPVGPPGGTGVASVTITPNSVDIAVGSSATLQAQLRTVSGAEATGAVTWSSANPAVSTVSSSGTTATVTAVSAGTTSITATSISVSGSVSGSVNGSASVTARALPILALTGTPARAFADSALVPAPRVIVVDAAGQPVTSGSHAVTIGLAAGSPAGSISGQTTAATVNGVATFPDLRIKGTGVGFRLQATSPTATSGPNAVSGALEVAVAPVVVDSTRLRLTSTASQLSSGTYVFQAGTGAPTIQSGAVLVGAQNGGFLRRVLSVSASGATVTATTEAAPITDVIREGTARTTTRIDLANPTAPFASLSTSGVTWGRTTARVADDWITVENGRYKFARKVLWDGGTDQLVLENGFLQFAPDVTLDFDIADWQVKRVNVQTTGNLSVGLGLTFGVTGSTSVTIPNVPVGTLNKSFLVQVGGWPVFGRVELTFKLVPVISAQAAAKITTSVSASGGVTTGAVFDGSAWTFNGTPAAQAAFQLPSFTVEASGSAGTRVGARVETRVYLYEVIGPTVWAEPYVRADIAADQVRNVATSTCRSAIELGAIVSGRIFSPAVRDFIQSNDALVTPAWPVCAKDLTINGTNSLAATQGNAQTADPGTTLPITLGVRVRGSTGSPVANAAVQWVVTSGGGAVASPTTPTDANGNAQVLWTLGPVAGEQRLEARLAGATGSPLLFTATARSVGTIGGLIVDDATGSPLANVSVDFLCGGVSGGTVRTGTDGRFTSPSLPAGNCSVAVLLVGYDALTLSPVAVVAGQLTNVGTLRLKKPLVGNLSGTVRSVSDSTLISGATIELRVGANVTTGTPLRSFATNLPGTYQFTALPPGVYSVTLNAGGFASVTFGLVTIVGGESRTQDFYLIPTTGAPAGIPAEQFVVIAPGTFQMGSLNGDTDESPVHTVGIVRYILMQKTEVTQAQWKSVMGTSPSTFTSCGSNCPVENVSWTDVQAFLTQLNRLDQGKSYRLPSEAEWEYAARAGTIGDYNVGDRAPEELGWIGSNSASKTHPTAQKLPNAWGLYDMHGNVWEWVNDWYSSTYYGVGPLNDPQGPTTGNDRGLRGGSYDFPAYAARSAYRGSFAPGQRSDNIGFRVVRNP